MQYPLLLAATEAQPSLPYNSLVAIGKALCDCRMDIGSRCRCLDFPLRRLRAAIPAFPAFLVLG